MSKVSWGDVREQVSNILDITGYSTTWIGSIFKKSEDIDFHEWNEYESELEKIGVFARIVSLIIFYLHFKPNSVRGLVDGCRSSINIDICLLNNFFNIDIEQIRLFYQEKMDICIDDTGVDEDIEEINYEGLSCILSIIFKNPVDLFRSLLEEYSDDVDIDELVSTNPDAWNFLTYAINLQYFDQEKILHLADSYIDQQNFDLFTINTDCPFSEITFELLQEVESKKSNHHKFFEDRLDKIQTYIERPLQNIFNEVSNQISEYISQIINFKGQVYFYEGNKKYSGRVYSWDCESIHGTRLFIMVSSDRLHYGFFAPFKSKNRQKFIDNCKKDARAIKSDLTLIKAKKPCFFHGKNPKLKRNMDFTIEDWFKTSFNRSIEYKHIQCSESMSKDKVLNSSFKEIVYNISSFFDSISSLIILAFMDDPISLIKKYCKPYNQTALSINLIASLKNQNTQVAVLQRFNIPVQINYTANQFLEDTSITSEELNRYEKTLRRKKQIIFAGSPGTGKTFIAQKFAKYLTSTSGGFVDLVQFHPAYTYEDFIRGLKPEIKDGHLNYNYEEGRFIKFCEKAQTEEYEDKECVFIIDEINRANISQVFGELMYLLEYRDMKIILSSGKPFSIPENVLIIGTMNTSDRSIALIDHALRRRFAFIKITPNYKSVIKKHQDQDFPVNKLIQVLKDLNQKISNSMRSNDYELGTSFFMVDNLKEEIEDIWLMEVEPYLEEYFFDNESKEILESFRWQNVKKMLHE